MYGYKAFKSTPYQPFCLAPGRQYESRIAKGFSDGTTDVPDAPEIELYTRGERYGLHTIYEVDGVISINERGFHFCDEPIFCYEYVGHSTFTVMCRVQALGTVIGRNNLRCTNSYRILEVLEGKHTINGITYVFRRGGLHSETEPALVLPVKHMWFRNGLIHRAERDGPAVIHSDGMREWWTYSSIVKTERAY